MAVYYNEIEPFAAQWLRNLIARNLIAPGEVDERSIVDVQPDDLRGFDQCHFFAGIGGWSYALRLAGWPDDRPVWTGSCPCQPFSVIGKRSAHEDGRHLWPSWCGLARERRPSAILGEQVGGADGLHWLDHVLADLEDLGYAVAAADLPACGVGAPHIRSRLWFVAASDPDAVCKRLQGREQSWAKARPDPRSGDGRTAAWWSSEPPVDRVDNGTAARMGRLRAYGNAIVPQVAAEVIGAFMECRP